MAATVPSCNYIKPNGEKCRNPDKEGMGCYKHYGLNSAVSPDQVRRRRDLQEALESGDQRLFVVPLAAITASGAFRENVLSGCSISPDALEAVQEAMSSLAAQISPSGVREDPHDVSASWIQAGLDVPARAEAASAELPRFAAALHERLGERVSLVGLSGFHRRTPAGRVQSQDELVGYVMVIDRDQPTETAVDPFIASYAPVRDRNHPVEEELASGLTPFGDVPWIGPLRDYVQGDHMWWDRGMHLPISVVLNASQSTDVYDRELSAAGRAG